MDLNFTETYMPSASEIPAEKLQEVRNRLVQRERLIRPDLDTRPNSVYGDLFLDPAAETIAAIEIGLGRIMSDLDPKNATAGVVFNCDFVEAFLSNFSVDPLEVAVAYGYVKLTFSASKAYEMPRSTRFQFNNLTTFKLDLPLPGGLFILPAEDPSQPGVNTARLVETSVGLYEVVVRVVSDQSGAVVSGTSGTINVEDFENLDAIVAVGDFWSGADAVSLRARAANVQRSVYSASPVSRGGTSHLLALSYPDVSLKSAVFSGDLEMTRNLGSFLGAGPNLMDVHVRRPVLVERTDVLRIPYLEDQNDTSLRRFIGVLNFLSPPTIISSVRQQGAEVNLLESAGGQVLSRSKAPGRAPLLSCGISSLEELWFDCPVTYEEGTPSLQILTDIAGNQYGLFEVTYLYDPSIPAVEKLLCNSMDIPWMDILVRGGVPVVINEFRVLYKKSPGVTFSTAQAREEIADYVNRLSYPSVMREGVIADKLYHAGAEGLEAIRIDANIIYTPATKVIPDTADLPSDNYLALVPELVNPPHHHLTNSEQLRFFFRDPFLGSVGETYAAVGPRSIHYVLDPNAIFFDEQ